MFRATVDGETFEGKPLAWTDYEMHLLGRDGRLHDFNPQDAKNAKKTSPNFVGYSVPEMRRALEREFGTAVRHHHHPTLHRRASARRSQRLGGSVRKPLPLVPGVLSRPRLPP